MTSPSDCLKAASVATKCSASMFMEQSALFLPTVLRQMSPGAVSLLWGLSRKSVLVDKNNYEKAVANFVAFFSNWANKARRMLAQCIIYV